ncbi:LacI family DNA-binding transcriptional regulator [Roseococcus sp.]|uniref:LacI family DNA-binding transcriptional regulator n=1 Tax=Roseococcus sp. TaxID=2109646 RepID=UPI003BACB68D
MTLKPRPPKPHAKIRIEEVARAAGVSAATVSRALNNPHLVSKELRQKVEKVTTRLGYVAHGAARALASRRSRALGAVVPTLSNTIFSDAIGAFQRRLEAENYTMLLATFDYDAEVEFRNVRTMIERGVDGLMLVGVTHGKPLYDLLASSGVPFVQTWAPARTSPHPTIGYDNAALTRMVVDHLVGLGHTEIGIVAGVAMNNDRVRARLVGMRAAMRRHKLPLPASRIVFTEYRIDAARAAFREMQQRGPMPTALIANNDIVAMGLMLEAQSQGIRVPRQLSIVGVGDLEMAAHFHPPLTTIRTPKQTIGTLAAEYLLARIHDRPVSLPPELPLELVVRGTTAPPQIRKDRTA